MSGICSAGSPSAATTTRRSHRGLFLRPEGGPRQPSRDDQRSETSISGRTTSRGDHRLPKRDSDSSRFRPRLFTTCSLAEGDACAFDQQKKSLRHGAGGSLRGGTGGSNLPPSPRVLSLVYSVEEAERRSRRWSREVQEPVLPASVDAYSLADLLLVPTSIGPWLALALRASILGAVAQRARWGARDALRCGKAFCRACKPPGSAALYCADCDRRWLGSESNTGTSRRASRNRRRPEGICAGDRGEARVHLGGVSGARRGLRGSGCHRAPHFCSCSLLLRPGRPHRGGSTRSSSGADLASFFPSARSPHPLSRSRGGSPPEYRNLRGGADAAHSREQLARFLAGRILQR